MERWKLVSNVPTLVIICKVPELQVRIICVLTEVSTFLIITQVSSGLKKSHILIFSKYTCS